MSQFDGGNVITSEAARALRRYKYNGSDKSLLYRFILSPLAESCLVFLPSWMAPNLVTTIGLSLTTASYLLLYLTAPKMLSLDTPAWVFAVAALGLFLYQTLDNMDGKQARRTSSSSPLGLIFDHGCDAINCCFGVAFVSSILNAGSNLPLLCAVFLNQVVPFFFTTWEHYYTDELILSIVNGPSEGVILGILCACLRGYFGPDLFLEPREELKGWPLGQALVAFSLCGVVVTTLKQLVLVYLARSKVKRSMMEPLFDVTGFVLLLLYGGGWAWCRPQLFLAMPYTMVLLLGLIHVDAAVHVMVCHVCNVKCLPIRPILVPFMMVVANSFFPGGPVLRETTLVWGFTLLAFVYECLYLYLVVNETSEALDIFIFKLGKRSDASKTGGAAATNGSTRPKTS